MKRTLSSLIFIVISSLILLTGCDDQEEDYRYTLTVESYYSGFSGYYYIDGSYEGDFTGVNDYTDSLGNEHYYYEKEIESFSSIKVFVYKVDKSASVTISVWEDGKEIATETSGSDEVESSSDTETIYVTTVGPLYYENE